MRERGPEAHAESAGTDPAEGVNPRVAQVLSEIGIDISESTPSRLTDDMVAKSDEVITMGCAMDSTQCPSIRLEKVVDWQLQDPSLMDIDDIRKMRETVRQKVESLLDDNEAQAKTDQPRVLDETDSAVGIVIEGAYIVTVSTMLTGCAACS